MPSFFPGVTEEWRIAPEDQPPTARRCSCEEPLLDTDTDGGRLCVWCGREPAVRLGPISTPTPPQIGGQQCENSVRRVFNPLAMADRKHIGFVVPVDMATALEQKAASQDRSVSAELRQMVRAHLAENETSPATTTEDVSRAVGSSPVGDQF